MDPRGNARSNKHTSKKNIEKIEKLETLRKKRAVAKATMYEFAV